MACQYLQSMILCCPIKDYSGKFLKKLLISHLEEDISLAKLLRAGKYSKLGSNYKAIFQATSPLC